jgi:hypothetical protein
MATLMPSLSSDEEDNVPANGKKEIIESDDNGDSSDDEVNEDFEFGGLLVSRRDDFLDLFPFCSFNTNSHVILFWSQFGFDLI